jgi:hypothetical protein
MGCTFKTEYHNSLLTTTLRGWFANCNIYVVYTRGETLTQTPTGTK